MTSPKLEIVTIADQPTRIEPVKPLGLDTYNSHPGTGLTAEALVSILREAEKGTPVRQFDLFDDIIETDGHLRGLHEGRREESSGKDWVLKSGRPGHGPSDKAAADLEERLRDPITSEQGRGFRDFISHHTTAPSHGFASTSLRWELDRGLIVPVEFQNIAHRRFAAPTPERASEIWLIAGTSSKDLVPLEPGLWAITRSRHRNPYAGGYLRTAAWWALFKRWAIRDWQVFATMFGLPYVLGTYDEGAGLATRNALEAAVKQIGEDGYAVLSKACEITVKTAERGDSSTVYPVIAKNADEEMSKLIAGGTLNTDVDGKGSYALGDVHESRAYTKIKADAVDIEATFTRDVGRPFVVWNGYAEAAAPTLKIHISRDSESRAKVVSIIGQLIDIDEDQLREEFAMRAPAPGRGVRMPTKTPAEGKPE